MGRGKRQGQGAPAYRFDNGDGVAEVIAVRYHRNGVCGAGFFAVLFDYTDEDGTRRMVATVGNADLAYDEDEELTGRAGTERDPEVRVMALDLMDPLAFGSNTWRGDRFATGLARAIRHYEKRGATYLR